jgi:deoxyribodipyrimidine photolyase-related protein
VKTVWILGDQLSPQNSALTACSPGDAVVLMIESQSRGSRVRYHKKKLVLLYSAMRHFAADLRRAGWTVDYHLLPETPAFQTGLTRHLTRHNPDEIILAEPNDWPASQQLPALSKSLGVPIRTVPTKQFLVPREEFQKWAAGSKRLLMEDHYRRVRRATGLLMNGKDPVGDAFNFDAANRLGYREWRKNGSPRPKDTHQLEPDEITRSVMELVEEHFREHPGETNGFWLPVDREGAIRWLNEFIEKRLFDFGPYEDLMVENEHTLFHSVLSPLLNLGLLSPLECATAAETAYRQEKIPLNSAEGFIRQIIGWREFINGVYWLRMPDYKKQNYFQAKRPLPNWYYTGNTAMNCLHQAIRQVIALGYNHHIQRLMVLGNFALIAGLDPQQVERWYLEMYVDAYDWVMAPNVFGMILFADGGFMATKPYAASANYINRMSNYCSNCRYNPAVRAGPDACPYNYLFWDFYDRNQKRLSKNTRVRPMLQNWQKRSETDKEEIRAAARNFFAHIEQA